MSEPIDQPRRREPRHPGADQRGALAEEEQPEIAVAQRPPGVRDRAHGFSSRLRMSPAVARTWRSSSLKSRRRLREPGALQVLGAAAHRRTFLRECDVHLPPITRVRLALHESALLERRDSGAHGLGPHVFRARKLRGGGSAVAPQAREHGKLGQRQLMLRGRRTHVADQPADGLGEVIDVEVRGLLPWIGMIADRQVN